MLQLRKEDLNKILIFVENGKFYELYTDSGFIYVYL